MTICRKCGTSNKDKQKFCTFCHELLIADPVELAKLEAKRNKKKQKAEKRQARKIKRWKHAPLMLIPIGIMNLINLLICADFLAIGFIEGLGKSIGQTLEMQGILKRLHFLLLGTIEIDLMPAEMVTIVLRTLVLAVAAFCIVTTIILSIVMLTRMVKWHKHKKKIMAKEAAERAAEEAALAERLRDAEMVHDASIRGKIVSYAELQKIADHRDEFAKPAPAKEIDIKEMYEGLQPQLWEYDDESVRRIIAAMAGSRMLLCSAGAIDSAGIFDSLSRTFLNKTEQYTCKDPKNMTDMLLDPEDADGISTHSTFAQSLYAARYAPQNLCLAGIKGAGAQTLSEVLSPMQPYFKMPSRGVALYMGKPIDKQKDKLPEGISFGKMLISDNVWVLSVLPEEERTLCMGNAFGQSCATLYLRNSRNIFPPEMSEEDQFTLPSVKAFENAVVSAEQDYYISEDLWKVIDQLEEQMNEACGVRFSNLTIRALERYTSVYMACGAKQTEAFDNGFAAIILTGYAEQMAVLAGREEGETLFALLERTVGRDRLPMTMEALASMGLN